MEREEVRDWTVTGKESFTTPGGSVSYPTGRGGKTYSFTRAPEARNAETPRPEARTASVSPFAREAVTQNVGTQSPPQTAPRPEAVRPAQAAVPQQAVQGAPVVLSHDGESRAYAVPVQGLPPYGSSGRDNPPGASAGAGRSPPRCHRGPGRSGRCGPGRGAAAPRCSAGSGSCRCPRGPAAKEGPPVYRNQHGDGNSPVSFLYSRVTTWGPPFAEVRSRK